MSAAVRVTTGRSALIAVSTISKTRHNRSTVQPFLPEQTLENVVTILIGASVSEPHLGSSTRPPSVCLSVCLYIYISYVRHFWSRGPRATRKRKPAHLKLKGHMHACCIYVANASLSIYIYISYVRHSRSAAVATHVQQLSDNQQRRLEAETTHEREERLQQLSAAQVRS